eukprot:scaffold75787_cov27-Tisochrysis_lutea.AAC.2
MGRRVGLLYIEVCQWQILGCVASRAGEGWVRGLGMSDDGDEGRHDVGLLVAGTWLPMASYMYI